MPWFCAQTIISFLILPHMMGVLFLVKLDIPPTPKTGNPRGYKKKSLELHTLLPLFWHSLLPLFFKSSFQRFRVTFFYEIFRIGITPFTHRYCRLVLNSPICLFSTNSRDPQPCFVSRNQRILITVLLNALIFIIVLAIAVLPSLPQVSNQ